MQPHWMDRIGIALAGTPRLYEPIFSEGWGDPARLQSLQERALQPPVPARLDLEARVVSEDRRRRVTDLRFPTPAGDLPDASWLAHARLIEPYGARRLTIGFASFNDHGYRTRSDVVAPLLAADTAVVLLENPYYGQRRPHPDLQPMRTVADLLSMGAAAVWEGLSLAVTLAEVAPWTIGFFGYSMGGNIAALAAATAPFPVACAALAASHSPGPVFTGGALAHAVAWEALGGEESSDQLGRVLGSASVLHFRPQPWTAASVIVAAERDGYIPAHAVDSLHRHWPGSLLKVVPGGHASLLKLGKDTLAEAIGESFDRFESMVAAPDDGR